MNYEEKAFEIIKKSIKSAIFIDEKARTFFQKNEDLVGSREEALSEELYQNFKNSGISLDIHKYVNNDEKNTNLKNYLFEDRDLVLLDWNLEDQSGELYSLELISDIVNRPHIHFCAIYTSEKGQKLDLVFNNLLSFFSNETEEYYIDIKEQIEGIEEISEIIDDLHFINIYRNSTESKKKLGYLFQNKKEILERIFKIVGDEDKKYALIKASISQMSTHKSKTPNPCPSFVSIENKTLVIDNTIITILNKEENNANDLLKNLSAQITKQNTSFTQLLGLEMQSIFSRSSAFIDSNLLHFTKDALLYHRENYKKEGLQHFFPEFIKEIMLEKANLNLRNIPISLLDDAFLDIENNNSIPDDSELIAMNIFYNSTKLKNDNKLNFGDVFKKERGDEYFICITALCDCLRPEKIDNTFFFAKGSPIKSDDALKLGDTAFISYLSSNQIVKWTDVNTIIQADHHKYSPVYIKPIQFSIIDSQISKDGKLNFNFLKPDGEKDSFIATYITTIKSNYSQRIANHAFSHPVRVGVDFVKK